MISISLLLLRFLHRSYLCIEASIVLLLELLDCVNNRTWVENKTHYPMHLAFSPNGRQVVSGGGGGSGSGNAGDRAVRLWQLPESVWPEYTSVPQGAITQVSRFKEHRNVVDDMTFSADGTRALSGGQDGKVYLWDVRQGTLIQSFPLHSSGVTAVALSPDDRLAVSGDYGGHIHVWDAASGRSVHELKGHSEAVISLTFSADRRRLLSAADDKTVRLWDVESGRELQTYHGTDRCLHADFSPTGETVLLIDGKTLIHWNPTEDKVLRRVLLDSEWSIVLSPDRRLLASQYSGMINLRHTDSGVPRMQLVALHSVLAILAALRNLVSTLPSLRPARNLPCATGMFTRTNS